MLVGSSAWVMQFNVSVRRSSLLSALANLPCRIKIWLALLNFCQPRPAEGHRPIAQIMPLIIDEETQRERSNPPFGPMIQLGSMKPSVDNQKLVLEYSTLIKLSYQCFKRTIDVHEIQQWTTALILREVIKNLKSKPSDSSTTMRQCTSIVSCWLVTDTRLTPGE